MTKLTRTNDYNRRHYGQSKNFVALLDDKVVATVSAYTKAEAMAEFRHLKIKFDSVRQF